MEEYVKRVTSKFVGWLKSGGKSSTTAAIRIKTKNGNEKWYPLSHKRWVIFFPYSYDIQNYLAFCNALLQSYVDVSENENQSSEFDFEWYVFNWLFKIKSR